MTKVTYIDLLPTEVVNFYKNIKIADRFITPHVAIKKTFFSRKSVKGLTQKSLLPKIALLWNALSSAEQLAWKNAGAERKLNGYRMFVADMCARIKNGIAGVATPSLLHQSWVGKLQISAPADEIKIAQLHPSHYWISKAVYGHKGMREPIEILEPFSLPLTIALNYKSNLVSTGAGSFAKFYADIWYSYQGRNLSKLLEISLDSITDWKNATATLSNLGIIIIGYTLYFHVYKMTGWLEFDNVKATHGFTNWVRDTYCEDILQTFTKAFYQVPEHWAPMILPSGAEYDSVYGEV